tara:strand:+ start:431 stop:1561 length:1131 start_codon:yes stop_codon:yes gene_type:complete
MKSKVVNILKRNNNLFKTISFLKGIVFDFKYRILSLKWNSNHNFFIDIANHQKSNLNRNLSIIWCGINENQDRSGLIQGLEKNFNLEIFYRPNKEYGLTNNSFYDLKSINKNGELLYNYLKVKSELSQVDYLFGQFMGVNINTYWLEKIQKLGIKIISLSWDDKLVNLWGKDYKLSCHSISHHIDYLLCSSIEPIKAYTNTNAFFFPLGSYDKVFSGDPYSKKTIDVLFIGNQYGARKSYIDFLIKNKINIEFYGMDWGTEFLSFTECAQKFKQAKIIIGIGYVSHSSKITTLKLRDFDASISGALYLTTRNKELEKLFPNNEIEFYESKNELLKKITFYLENDTKRIEKASKLQKFTMNNFSWDILFKKLNSYLS